MDISKTLIKALERKSDSAPPHGWINDLPEAFAATDKNGEVIVIGYKGEWYFTRKSSLRVRLRNRLVGREQ